MNKIFGTIAVITISCILFLSSCQIIGDIFKAGMWTGILFVVVIIGVLIFLLSKVFGGKK